MNVELVNTGSELMLGRVLNTHQQWLCRRLADLGHVVTRQVAIADTGREIQNAVREALSRADLVITTGGLGPTSDDITRELIAELLGKKLVKNLAVQAHIEKFFAQRGPPRELRPMFDQQIVPLLHREFAAETFVCRTLRTSGIGESRVQEFVEAALQPVVARGLEVGYCARPGAVDVRLTASGADAKELVAEGARIVQTILGASIYGFDDDEMETVVVRQLIARRKTLALAESCTGGALADQVTDVPGASEIFLGGVVSYANTAKEKLLGVRAETLAAHGAVSEAVAREMAVGVREKFGADFALAVTGIAGPGGGTPEKPVGTVYISLASAAGVDVKKFNNVWDRATFKQVTAMQALDWLRQTA